MLELQADLLAEREKSERLGRAVDWLCEKLKVLESEEELLRALATFKNEIEIVS